MATNEPLTQTKGQKVILFQSEDSYVYFRNMNLRPLQTN